MRTAILYSGGMRSFEKCLPTQHWNFIRHFPNADFFVSTMKDADSHKAELLRAKYPNARVEIEVVDEQPDCIEDICSKGVSIPRGPNAWQQGRPYTHEPYAISVHPQAVLRQLWQLQKCWELFVSRTPDAHKKCGTVIRCRPDLWFHSCDIKETQYSGESGATWTRVPLENEAMMPWWGRFGAENDRFAILGSRVAPFYFNAYAHAPRLITEEGCPLHPESLIAASLELANAKKVPLLTEFSTLRGNGEMRRWEQEVSPADLARVRA